MNSKLSRKILLLSVASSLLMYNTFLDGVSAASTNSTNVNVSTAKSAVTTNKVNTIALSKKSYASLLSANVTMNEKGNIFTYTVAIFNNDSKSLNFIDYWVNVRSKSGKTYKTQLAAKDKDKKYIQPGSSQVFTFYTEVDSNIKVTDMLVDYIKWDFSAVNYTRRLGTFNIPNNYSSAVAAGNTGTVATETTKLKTRIEKSIITKDKQYYYVNMQFNIENIGYRNANMNDLLFNLTSSGRTIYSINSDELKDVILQPGEKRTVTIRAALPKTANMTNLQLMASTYEETDKILIPRGVFQLPTAIAGKPAEIGATQNIIIKSQPVAIKVNSSYFVQSESGKKIKAQITFNNQGNEPVAFTDYEYAIRTNDDVIYQVTVGKTGQEAEILTPKTNKIVNISADMPENVDMSNSEVLIYTSKTETSKTNYLLASFKLPIMSNNEGNIGEVQKVGNYSIRVNNIQRLPWSKDDVLSASMTIINETNSPLKIPAYQGSFIVNGVKMDSEKTKTVYMDDSININPKGEVQLTVYTKIPYSTNISDIRFLVEEKLDDKNTNVIMAFGSKSTSEFKKYNQEDTYEFNISGSRSSINVQNVNIYNSEKSSKLFYGEVVLQNMENRISAPNKLRGVVKLDSGEVIPLNASDFKKTLLPQGNLLLSFWAELPKHLDSENIEFIIGQGVTGNKLSSGEDAPEALVDAVAFDVQIDKETSSIAGSLENIKFSDYLIGFRNFYAYLNTAGYDTQGMKLDFEYDLIRSNQYDEIAEDHIIVVEFVDKNSNVTYTKEYALSKTKDNEEILTEGSNNKKSIVIDDKDISNKISKHEQYTVNIYDKVGDNKLLLASKDYRWFFMQR